MSAIGLVQFDAFSNYAFRVVNGIGHDEDAELAQMKDVRVLVRSGSDPEVAARLLRKVADWIEQDGTLLANSSAQQIADHLLKKASEGAA